MYLPTAELAILRVLEDGRWRNPYAISLTSPAAGLHVSTIRSMLKQLARRQFVERGSWGSRNWGEYRITDAGAFELRVHHGGARGQLSLVKDHAA